jgi:hypothetical protein
VAAEFVLKRAQPLVESFGGCGAQFNNHVFAPETLAQGVKAASFPDLRKKVLKLAPQFVRIFYNDDHAGTPFFDKTAKRSELNRPQSPKQKKRWDSFVDVVKLAHEAGAVINITWSGGHAGSPEERATSMERFANVLSFLVNDEKLTGVRWATVANEPNTIREKPDDPAHPPNITAKTIGEMYRELDAQLRKRTIRRKIFLMGGDLIEGETKQDAPKDALHRTSQFNQFTWFRFLTAHHRDVLDAYSVHIYWNFDEVPRILERLTDVKKVAAKVKADAGLASPLPIYVTEFGVRGKDIKKPKGVDPGNYRVAGSRPVPIHTTRIAAFQHALFVIRALQLGYIGMSKWDCFFGRYDLIKPPESPPKGNQQYFAIGPASPSHPPDWQLHPMYFLLRLITATTEREWNVLRVEPPAGPSTSRKQLVAFARGDNLTILGLNVDGASLNTPSGRTVDYTIGRLPARTPFQLLLWNEDGKTGALVHKPTPVTTDGSGTATVRAVPLHSVFALTTKALPASLV